MSATGPTDPAAVIASSPGPSKKAKKKKGKNKPKDLALARAGDDSPRQHDDGTDEPGTPIRSETRMSVPATPETKRNADAEPAALANGHVDQPSSNGHTDLSTEPPNPPSPSATTSAPLPPGLGPAGDVAQKPEATSRDGEALTAEVQELRKQLEGIRQAHAEEVKKLQAEVEESTAAKETAEEQYQNLVDRVEKIKETLSSRLRKDKQELEETTGRAEHLEAENDRLREGERTSAGEIAKLRAELQDAGRELATLRSRSSLSTQNWQKEKDYYARMVAHLKEEVESASNAMGEWEVIAMEERSVRESLSDKVSELREELAGLRDSYQSAASERDHASAAVDNLQRSLQEIQDARRRELREMVETSQEEAKTMRELVRRADVRAAEAEAARASLAAELERTAPFEKEVKEKNLLIGKLRHEAIVLNDHLTKALRYLKKTKPEDNVDRQIVTNHLLHFLNLDRADPKRFQILQVMAGYLNWTDEQREQAGLTRPGASGNSLRLPLSPFHRTPSTPSFGADFFSEPSGSGKESLADLWAGFLERSALEESGSVGGAGGGPSTPSSRKGSTSSAAARPETRGGGAG